MKLMDFFHTLKIRPWLVWGLGSIFALYTFLLQGSPSVMIPQLMKTYQIDVIKIGVLTSSFFYTYIIMQIPAGILVDLWGPRRILKVSFLLCSITVGWFAFSHYFWEGQVSRMVMGITTSPAIICAFCLGSRWFKPALFTLIVALTEFLALSGGVIGEGGLAKAVVTFGWRETMLGVAVAGLLLTFLSLFIIHDFPDHDQPLHDGTSFKEAMKATRKSFIKILSIKPLWLNGIYAGFVFAIFPAFAALWGIPYFENRYKISVDLSALVASTFFIGGCIGTLTLGWMSVYITKRRPIMIWGTLIAFVLSLSIIYVPHIPLPMMFVLMLLFGFFSSSYALCFALADTYVSHKNKGVAMGFTNMLCIAFGAPIFQPLIGFLLKWSTECEPINRLKIYTNHDYTIALSVLPISLLIALILSFFIKEDQQSLASP
ncbi:MAG: MFS transporter [Simkaniaceae bacterium]|nr:MAG: MFS transporter [Simkaniaceae bacterium]